jgi:hypothetical protein
VCVNVLHHVEEQRIDTALDELARVTGHTLLLEIKNADSPYFRAHGKLVEGVRIFPVTVSRVSERLSARGFTLVRKRALFLWAWLSPLIVLHFERLASADESALEDQGSVSQRATQRGR